MCGLLAFQNGMALDIYFTMWNVSVVILKCGIFLNQLKIGRSKRNVPRPAEVSAESVEGQSDGGDVAKDTRTGQNSATFTKIEIS